MQIDATLVRRLIAAQFPQWADCAIAPVEPNGWDNRTFRLGDDLSVRLPSAECYVAQVEKEHRWLPVLGPRLPVAIPQPVAKGEPGEGYPWCWSVYRWLEGESAAVARIGDVTEFAIALASFLKKLRSLDASDGPPAGSHNFFRGGRVSTYDQEMRDAIATLRDRIDTKSVQAIWDRAIASTWQHPPVWVHGDMHATNLLVRDGKLAAVIDFGCCGTGDPACDYAIAWTFFSGRSRRAFRDALTIDDATWDRSRGWALWKALITLAGTEGGVKADEAQRTLDAILGEAVA